MLEEDLEGMIYKGIMPETREEVTLKVTYTHFMEGIPPTCFREISILRMLSDNAFNIVKLRDVECQKIQCNQFHLHIVFDDMKSNLFLFINIY